jgi:hypothetical protein
MIDIEACSGWHHQARCFAAHGHTVRLMDGQLPLSNSRKQAQDWPQPRILALPRMRIDEGVGTMVHRLPALPLA